MENLCNNFTVIQVLQDFYFFYEYAIIFVCNWAFICHRKGDLMKKKMLTVGIGIIVVSVLVIAGWYILFMNFGIGQVLPLSIINI